MSANRWIIGTTVAICLSTIAAMAAILQAKPQPAFPSPAGMLERHESLLNLETIVLDSTGWPDSEVVAMVAATYAQVLQWDRQQTWQPGLETHLAIKGLTDVEIRATILRINGQLAVEAANAVFEAMGKPLP